MEVKRIELKGARNTRDVGQYQTEDGRKVKSKVFFRSGRLDKINRKHLLQFLKENNVRTIIDLRTQIEVNEGRKLQYPEEIDYYHIPVLNQEFFGITHEKNMSKVMFKERKRITSEASGDDYMINMYKSIVFNPSSQRHFRAFFDLLLEYQEGSIIYHCTGGKDRTGIATMFILTLLGVSREDILDDFEASEWFNRKYNRSRSIAINSILFFHPRFKEILLAMLHSKRIYMEKLIEAIEEKYGSVINYLREEIKIDEEKQKKLQDLFLE